MKTRRILCAEDNELLGGILVNVFKRAGHHAEHVCDGQHAWELICPALDRFDVVVTDHHMPRLDGLKLVTRLRQVGYPGRIVVHSSNLTDGLMAEYRRLGVQSFVPKSSRADALLVAVERIESRGTTTPTAAEES